MNRIIKEILVSIVLSVIVFYLSGNLKIAIVSFILSFGLLNFYRPEKRYWRAFWKVFVVFSFTNSFSLQLIKKISSGELIIKHEESIIVTIVLGALLILFPILDYMERNSKNSKPDLTINGENNIVIKDLKKSDIKITKNAK